MAFKYDLGLKVKCLITGFEGAILGRSDHLTGCNQYYVQGPVDKDGKMTDGHWFDEDRIKPTSGALNYAYKSEETGSRPGADIPHNPRR